MAWVPRRRHVSVSTASGAPSVKPGLAVQAPLPAARLRA